MDKRRNLWSPTYLLGRTCPRYGTAKARESDVGWLFIRRGFEVAQIAIVGP